MRDANGTGNIYFDVIFKDGIPIKCIIFYAILGLISLFNLTLVPILFYSATLNRSHHKNLRLVLSNLYIAFLLVALGNLIYTILVLTRISDIKYDPLFEWSRFIASLGPGIWRTTFVAIVLERLAATLFCKSYEHKAPLLLGIVLFICGDLGVFIPVLYFLVRVSISVTIIFIASTDIVSVLAMFLLNWSNQSMMKLKFDAKIALTHRYQIAENLRVVQIMTPVIFVGTAFDIAAVFALFLETSIDYNNQLRFPCYLFITNLYVTFAFFLYMHRDKRTRRKMMCILHKNSKVATEKQVRNIHGRPLIIEETPDIHFKNLEQYWK